MYRYRGIMQFFRAPATFRFADVQVLHHSKQLFPFPLFLF